MDTHTHRGRSLIYTYICSSEEGCAGLRVNFQCGVKHTHTHTLSITPVLSGLQVLVRSIQLFTKTWQKPGLALKLLNQAKLSRLE